MPARKTPVEQKVLNRSYRPSRHGKLTAEQEAAVDAVQSGGIPEPPKKPETLGGAASAMWDQVLETRPGMIWPSDAVALTIYCEWWGIFSLCLEKAKASKGSPKLTSLGIATDKLLLLGAKFGLTPKDRAALPVIEIGPRKSKVMTRQKTKLDEKPPK